MSDIHSLSLTATSEDKKTVAELIVTAKTPHSELFLVAITASSITLIAVLIAVKVVLS